jgi:hypothetical protein
MWQDGSMNQQPREFFWMASKCFTGWRCTGCGWARRIVRLGVSAEKEKRDAKAAFDEHQCRSYPLERNSCVDQPLEPIH